MMHIVPASPLDPEVTRLIRASHALMDELFPAESNHHLMPEELAAPGIHFFAARRDGQTIGCGAVAEKDGYGEIKSVFVDPAARGSGAAQAIMRMLEDHARTLKLPLLRLETGDRLHAARRLYARHGFTERGPYGDYREDPLSVFMEKRLAPLETREPPVGA
ncbi:GNAT family N-acetyltransferase [Pseudooceanicola sp.]|jgi:putative acetyltransferase|uniref:GNAT family N-acetyltransferase n=1 Tax=Pseudooceanicola sp. TaxID=1914328 RepID=UPI004059E1AF